ncbi:hypothetical protein H2198_008567 [Neophaeococcomyces mojaviensis]|uniref:Uncharacterized protein n=1 Tax=Neophaeococcomyces mojaviensis TaxID=3383035 RepID=A0ACC2ZX05_9EURO|nr:hypothetical protein H2198_008567 [Knufia sp. JES_112]
MAAQTHNGMVKVGDTVNVPGEMHGVVRFVGSVNGKKGTFAGVELASEYAARGKNSGDVQGKHYFHTAIGGSGIFLPVEKAEKRMSASSTTSSAKRTTSVTGSPTTPAVGRKTPRPVGIQKPSFSQSLGPATLQARVSSPTALRPPVRRESLARPQSPLRPQPLSPLRKAQNVSAVQTPAAGKLQTPKTRPSVGLAKSTMGTAGTSGIKASALRAPSYANGGPNKFSQNLRQSTSRTPSRMRTQGAPPVVAATPLGPEDRFDEDDTILEANETDGTPTPAARNGDRAAQGDIDRLEQEAQKLRQQLEERDRQLTGQATSIADMERMVADLQNMLPATLDDNRPMPEDEAELPRDVQALRAALREKNERIKALSAEFDANRADFRSTIDTLEMASTETERVYEQRVEDLLEQIRHLQERNEDVDSVAQQFKQLEELVQELEEGLEESRRAEAEARSEVEFLRGEVERGKSELRRERERHATKEALEGGSFSREELEELQLSLSQKDDEIRGLKAIIQGLQNTAHQDTPSRDAPSTPKTNGIANRHSKTKSINPVLSPGGRNSADTNLQRQIHDLESLLQQKSSREEELQEEVRELRKSVNLGGNKWSLPTTGFGGTAVALGLGHRRTESSADKHNSAGSQKTIVGQIPYSPGANSHRRKDSTVPGPAEHRDDNEQTGRGSPLKDALGIDTEGSEEANEERRRRSAEAYRKPPQAPASVSEASTAAQWCEICEESGHDILNCANMMGSSTHRQPSPAPELRSGRDVVREGLRRSNGSGHLSAGDRPAPLRKSTSNEPPHPPPSGPLPPPPPQRTSSLGLGANSNGGGSNRSSATPASSALTASSTTATPTKSTVVEGTGSQAGMIAGKTSGVIDPDRWCALCERDGHESVDCPMEDAF